MSEVVCNNCNLLFPDVGAFFAHREDCRIQYKKKPHYREVEKEVIMPGRMQPENYIWVARYLTERDGYRCFHCGQKPARDDPPLQVDHADGNEHNYRPDNLHWLCSKDNLEFRKLSTVDHVRIIAEDSAKNGGVCVTGSLAGELYQNTINTDDVPIEIKINIAGRRAWDNWISEKVEREGLLAKFDAIYGGAKAARVSSRTTERYFKETISCEGEYEFHSEKGGYIIRRQYESHP
jgi:hypothetical protein